eukprot:TRINITY_DN5751_c0_g1_i2.p1 TRINITY_DN5751_c0_g1~~TRINITY_DN5751_c0_g1_i2.p1  ORF type:complete len:562 (-),score=180.13 TRINITY_DN5751_c0_g1_i2:149-1789(-)
MAEKEDFHSLTIPRFQTKIKTKDEDFRRNYEEMTKLVDELNERLQMSLDQGKPEHIEKHLKAGRLLARERIELMLDEDSPFLEIAPLAGWGQEKMTLGGSIVGGIGLVCGTECLVSASVPTIKGGTMNKVGVKKSARLSEIAFQNRLPSIALTQSGGADLTQQYKVFHEGGGGFRELARKSKAAIPTINVVFGSSTAGGAYLPGMSDYTIMVKKQAKVFLGGPPLVKMATGEEVDDESLGGAEMHSRVSGVSDFLAENELHAIRLARQVVQSLNYKKKTPLPRSYFAPVEEPYYDPEEILGIVSANVRIPFDSREVIARIADGSRFFEFKPLYGSTLVTCFTRIHGIPIGILANNGVLFSEAANKATQFIQLCNQNNTPLLFLHNISGFMVGRKYEEEGIIKNGAKMINAVSNSEVPAITIVMGSSYGAGNYGMCGRAYKPRFLFSWPNSKCSVMGTEQLAGTMDIVMREAAAKAGRKVDEEMAEMRKQMFCKAVDEQSDVYFTSSRLVDDGVIDPRETRNVVGMCLEVLYGDEVRGGNIYGVSRM